MIEKREPSPRPAKLPLWNRLRSNLLQAPPFLFATVFFGSLSLLVSRFDKQGKLQHRLARRWAQASVAASGQKVKVIGLENIPAGQAVFAANHTSYMDTPVVFASLPFQFRILAKKELWGLPFIGWYLDRSGQIPIDTANPRATLSSLGAGVRALRDGLNLFIFPEGGRTNDGDLLPFLNGAAYLALRAQVPLVPVALIGVFDLLPPHTRHFYLHPDKRSLKLIIGPPIPTTGLTPRDSETVTNQLRETIHQLIQQNTEPIRR
ncbi:lysophospholipid acyltransferase family protein [Acidicapsa ligni]|uniref:lysophospholipid acyltransferase family protein n=1 Tax=Acidicapsa ligni TaxID=542300 RepID=UPI0021DF655C|nr:lysophospholipid acyltransferase family protein [Acidicapsa ligni]